jgi:ribose transport system permease protein
MASYAPNSSDDEQNFEATPNGGRRLKISSTIRRFAPLGVLIALLAGLGLFQPSFLSLYSLSVLAGESSVILVLAAGQTLVILLGGIDLSMAAAASLASVLIALSLPWAGVAGLLAVLALTALIGAAQGFVHTRAQLPSFVVTLAGLGLWSGLALVIGRTTIPVTAGYEAVGWLRGRDLGVPHAFAFAVFATGALVVMLRWSPIGRFICAIGMGEVAAILSGVPVGKVKILVFTLSGLFSGMAGMMMVARTYGGNPTIADSLLLPSIAAVVIGGTAITGGFGGLGRTIIGALTIGVLRVGIAVVGLNPAYEPIVYGLFIVVAVALSIDRSTNAIVK